MNTLSKLSTVSTGQTKKGNTKEIPTTIPLTKGDKQKKLWFMELEFIKGLPFKKRRKYLESSLKYREDWIMLTYECRNSVPL